MLLQKQGFSGKAGLAGNVGPAIRELLDELVDLEQRLRKLTSDFNRPVCFVTCSVEISSP